MKKAVFDSPLETKALYNSLRMLGTGMNFSAEDSWKVEEFRQFELNALFDGLRVMGIVLNKPLFYQWSAHCETPEELLDFLFLEEGLEEQSLEDEMKDHLYLLLFELWRRLIPEKRSLSLVADEIDHVIFAFDSGKEVRDEEIENAIEEWVRLLNRLQDEGHSAKEALQAMEPYFAHNVPEFIVDFLLDVTDRGDNERFLPLFEKTRIFLTSLPLWVKVIDLKFCLRDDLTLLNKKLGELVAHVLTTQGVESEIIFCLCDIALELDRGELFIRLLERVLPDLQEREEIDIVIDLLADFVEERSLLALKPPFAILEKERKTKSVLFLKDKLLQIIVELKKETSVVL